MMMGSDNGLWIEPDTIVEQQEVFIKGIYQASNGVVWFRSDQGILSYDGVSWIKHGIYWGNYGAIGLKAGAHEATDGTIWFNGSFTSAPPTLDGSPVSSFKDGKWEKHYPPGAQWLADVTQTSDGRIWAFRRGGIWSYVKGEEWVHEIGTASSVRGFIESPAGRYWITFDGNVSYFDGNTWVSAPRPAPFAGDDLRFFEDGNGDLWVTGNGIYKWQETEKMVRENG